MTETNTAGKNLGRLTENILIPLPDHDFDPTECAIPWKICNSRGWKFTFSTELYNLGRLKGSLMFNLGWGFSTGSNVIR